MRVRPARSNLQSLGLWRIFDDRIIAVDRAWPGPTTVLVPSEDVLVLAVDLPFATRRERLANLPFAVEDSLGEPIAVLHFALGVELAPRRHLCGIVRHGRMQQWLALLGTEDLSACVLMPDALALSLPDPDCWTVRVEGGRALVRTDQGTGFAVSAQDLPAVWQATNRPRLHSTGETLPAAMHEGVAESIALVQPDGRPLAVLPPLDLRQGAYVATRPREMTPFRIAATIAALGIAAHLAILGADTLTLHFMAERREAEARALLAQAAPQMDPGEDLAGAADRLVPGTEAADRPFTRLLAQTSGALAGAAPTFNVVSYEGRGPLNIQATFADAAALDRALASMQSAGLDATGVPAGVDQASLAGGPGGLNAVITVGSGAGR